MAAPSRYIVGYFRSLHFSAWIVACMLCPVNYIGQWIQRMLARIRHLLAGVRRNSTMSNDRSIGSTIHSNKGLI